MARIVIIKILNDNLHQGYACTELFQITDVKMIPLTMMRGEN